MHSRLARWFVQKRTCAQCGLVWAKDWRVVLFTNLKHLGGFVMLSAVTPPGQERLPWDEAYCAHLESHSLNAKRLGCRIDPDALVQWSHDISKRWKRLHNASRTLSSAGMVGACRC